MTNFTRLYSDDQLRRFLLVEAGDTGVSEERILECIEPNISHFQSMLAALGAEPTDEAILEYFTTMAFTLPHAVGQKDSDLMAWARQEAQLTAGRIHALKAYFSATS
jgi:hypothetical protein